jgi:hypothetical protein
VNRKKTFIWTFHVCLGRRVNEVPFTGLAEEIILLSQNGRKTPVLVTPRYLTVRNRFLFELSRELLACESFQRSDSRMQLRIDWLCNASLLRQRFARWRTKWINAAIQRNEGLGDRAVVVVSASIGRRGLADNTVVLGFCDEDQDLPTWAQKIQLIGLPRHHLQPIT